MPGTHESPRSKLRGISLAEYIDLTEASFEEFDPLRLKSVIACYFTYKFSDLYVMVGPVKALLQIETYRTHP